MPGPVTRTGTGSIFPGSQSSGKLAYLDNLHRKSGYGGAVRGVISLVLFQKAFLKEGACKMRFKGLKQKNSSLLSSGLLSTRVWGTLRSQTLFKCALLNTSIGSLQDAEAHGLSIV